MKCEIKRGKDISLDQYFRKMLALESIEIDAGYLTNKKHPQSDISIGAIAVIQQYGSVENNIPERPFMTDGALIASQDLPKFYVNMLRDYLLRKKGLAAFQPIAKATREGIAKAIASQRFTKLAPITIKLRRDRGNASTHILIDTGTMINEIETKVRRRRRKK